ncbi:MAG: phosphoenolpyruvate--protein phosphotransferase, partial [Pirellulales bacterium]
MVKLKGISIAPGYASGSAIVYGLEIERTLAVPHREIVQSEIGLETKRLNDALELTSRDMRPAESEPTLVKSTALLSVHATMAKDIAALVRQRIGREFVSVEQALDSVVGDFVERLQRLDNEYFREREQDVRDVGRQMMRHLSGAPASVGERVPPGSIVVARELLPSETIALAKAGVIAIVTEHGGKYSHTAILARSLGIPAITGIHNITSQIPLGARLLVDGVKGCVIVAPSSADEAQFVRRKQEYNGRATMMADNEILPSVTRDGVEISLLANIARPEEIGSVATHNLGGAGLFRTEFLFLESHERPGLQMQATIYENMANGLAGLPLVIRTFDLGGDKLPPFLVLEESECQGSLHLRGLRFSLAEGELLDTQLRAIANLAQTSDIRILFPMVIGGDDFSQAIAAVDRVVDQFKLVRRPLIGAMIETPAALYALDEILDLADFVAIGTNDLAQYMLAADRDLAEAPDDCTAMHPAVLRAIKQVVQAAEKWQCPVCVCGEEAGDVDFACLLVGLGIRELS